MHLFISENILLFISAIGILQGILLAALVYFHPKSDKSVNKFLALYILAITLVMSMGFFMRFVSWQDSYFHQSFPMISAPLLYLYLRSFKETITWKKALPHFLWYFAFLIPTYLNLHSLALKYPNEKNVPVEALQKPATIIINYLRMGVSILYYFLARRTLNRYQKSIKHLFSETSNFDLQWTRYLVNGFLVVIFCGIVFFSLMIRFPEHFNELLLINMTVATPYIYLATYKGILQPTIWQLQPGISKEKVEEEIHEAEEMDLHKSESGKINSIKTSEKSTGKLDELVGRIILLMEKEKIYQETELTLQNLADKLQTPSYQVSQAINEGMEKTFYDLINNYRVEEAKRLLLDPKNSNYTILSVGFEAGFNSKTTFNTVFKKFTGLTPTDFRNQQKLKLSAV
ncbi:MAG: AraC family transcriptional regulator [Bacteroidetes bacterium]|nr:AraC family transcriptional regulator [Bacteroidota bacterium]